MSNPFLQRPVKLKSRYFKEGLPYLVSEKMDGIRAYWYRGTLWSRQHKPIPNAHIQANFAVWSLPDGTDMELCCRDDKGRISLAAAQSAVMSKQGTPAFEAYAFANLFDDDMSNTERVADHIYSLHVVKQIPVTTLNEVLAVHKAVTDRGGEGVVVKPANAPYAHTVPLKLKPHYTI